MASHICLYYIDECQYILAVGLQLKAMHDLQSIMLAIDPIACYPYEILLHSGTNLS